MNIPCSDNKEIVSEEEAKKYERSEKYALAGSMWYSMDKFKPAYKMFKKDWEKSKNIISLIFSGNSLCKLSIEKGDVTQKQSIELWDRGISVIEKTITPKDSTGIFHIQIWDNECFGAALDIAENVFPIKKSNEPKDIEQCKIAIEYFRRSLMCSRIALKNAKIHHKNDLVSLSETEKTLERRMGHCLQRMGTINCIGMNQVIKGITDVVEAIKIYKKYNINDSLEDALYYLIEIYQHDHYSNTFILYNAIKSIVDYDERFFSLMLGYFYQNGGIDFEKDPYTACKYYIKAITSNDSIVKTMKPEFIFESLEILFEEYFRREFDVKFYHGHELYNLVQDVLVKYYSCSFGDCEKVPHKFGSSFIHEKKTQEFFDISNIQLIKQMSTPKDINEIIDKIAKEINSSGSNRKKNKKKQPKRKEKNGSKNKKGKIDPKPPQKPPQKQIPTTNNSSLKMNQSNSATKKKSLQSSQINNSIVYTLKDNKQSIPEHFNTTTTTTKKIKLSDQIFNQIQFFCAELLKEKELSKKEKLK
jgi:hypothetical protein